MNMKRLLIFALLLTLSSSLHAQRFNQKAIYDNLRHGQWEASLLGQASSGFDLSGDQGSSIDVDDAFGFGFTIGYNLNAHWNFSYKFTLNSPDYSAVIVPQPPEGEDPVARTIDYQLDKYAHALNATWHWFDGPLTPFLEGGIGYTRIDTNVPSQPPVTGCWWDPWWGYICDTQWKTYDTSEITYNAGIGVRWDVNGALFFRGAYNREWISIDAGDLEFDTLSLSIGLMW
ncbi:MAG: porin family protein [Xanthomonadales bacterium]|nr:porin family protein [Gammaproteobacteria bacterium]MBT8050997.1 porin family protein [Gammaproteobacteria bacterium]MBT8056588.1 porin family protein [Gammaproteobacteria bacterium]NNJ79188.1 porin family protein [Xanthomonadales bacterium]NNL04544.1 porin family protein [Xanthomonadales bacterium]